MFVPDITLAGGTAEELQCLCGQLAELRELGIDALYLEKFAGGNADSQMAENPVGGKERSENESSHAAKILAPLLSEAKLLDMKIILPLPFFSAGKEKMEFWRQRGVSGFHLGDVSAKKKGTRAAVHDRIKELRTALPEEFLLCGAFSKGSPKALANFVKRKNRELHLLQPILRPALVPPFAWGNKRLLTWLGRWQKGISLPLLQTNFQGADNLDPQLVRARLTLALCVKGVPVLRESDFSLATNQDLAAYAGRLLAFRAQSSALKEGGFLSLQLDGQVCRFARRHKQEAVGVAINLSPQSMRVPILGQVLFGNTERSAANLELAAYEALILKWHTEPLREVKKSR